MLQRCDINKRGIMSWTYTIFVVSIIFVSCQAADIIEPPTDAAAMAGNDLNLTCRVDGETSDTEIFSWHEHITEAAGVRIFSDPEFPPPLDTSQYAIYGRYDLCIKNLEWQDGGLYSCRLTSVQDGQGAHVFVFEEMAQTALRMKAGEKQLISCQSRFGAHTGFLTSNAEEVPTMEFMVNSVLVEPLHTTTIDQSESTPYITTGEANYTARIMDHGKDFTCSMITSSPIGYRASSSIQMDIQFPVEEPEFAPVNQMYYVGEQLNCTAEGNPLPSYEWESIISPIGEGIKQPGAHLLITEEMITDPDNPENRWRCTVTNTLENEQPSTQSTEIQFTVERNPDVPDSGEQNSGPAAWKIGVGVGVPLAIIVIAAAIIAGVVLYKRRKQTKEAETYASKMPPPEIGTENIGASFPGDGYLSNGIKPVKTVPISSLPNPEVSNYPANRTKDSPGYADLGVKQISNSYPGLNVSVNSVDSFDDSPQGPPPTNNNRSRPRQSHVNHSFEQTTPPGQRAADRPNYLNVGPNHPDTFV